MKRLFYRRILRRILRRNAPSIIPRSGDRGKAVDCFSVTLEKNDEPWVLVESVAKDHLSGRSWSGESFDEEVKVPWSEALDAQLRITHFYGLWDFKFSDIFDYIRVHSTGYYRLLVWMQLSRQYLYNNIRIARSDRMSVLRYLVEENLENPGTQFSAFGLATSVHSSLLWMHPSSTRIRRYYGMVLESLIDSGELSSPAANRFIVESRALTTLSEYELEERRHDDAQKTQRRIVWLTIIVVGAAVAQAYFGYLDNQTRMESGLVEGKSIVESETHPTDTSRNKRIRGL